MTDFGGLFGGKDNPLDMLSDLLQPKSKPDLPCSHVYGSDNLCHHCKKPKPKAKQAMRRKVVDGVSYIHADDVAALLEANKIQPGTAKSLRALNEEK